VVDPYEWLGIPKSHRPPTHYQLLSLSPKVADPAEIRAAADRQLRRVQPHLTGPDGSLARILRAELVQARDTLLDPDRRAMYDALSTDGDGEPAEPLAQAAPDLLTELDDVPPTESQPEPEPAPAAGWWDEQPVEQEAAEQAPWWHEAVPDEPGPPTAPPPAPKPIPTGKLETSRPRPAPLPTPKQRSKPEPVESEPVIARPTKKSRGMPVIATLLIGIVVVGAVAAGTYFGFLRKKPTTPAGESKDLTQTTTQPPRPTVDREPKEDEVLPDPPTPTDFTERLRPKLFKGHEGGVAAISTAKSGQRFVSIGFDQTVRIWSVDRGEPATRHRLKNAGVGVTFYNNDRGIAATDSFTLALLDATRMKPAKSMDSPKGGVSSLAVTPDGSRAFTGLTDGFVRLWDIAGGRFDEWAVATRGPIAVAISADGTKGVAAVNEGPVSLWDLRTRNQLLEWTPHRGGAVAVALSPDGTKVATAGADGTAAVYDLTAKNLVCRMSGHAGPLAGIAWLTDGRQVVTASVDETTRLWNAETGDPRRWVRNLSGRASSLAIDPLDRFVLVGTSAGPIHLIPLPRVRSEAVAGPPGKPPADPLAVPDAEAVEAAIGKVRIELKTEFGYQRPDDIALLADNLRRRAAPEDIPPPLRYGLLREAQALAVKVSDPITAMAAIDDMAAWFDIDPLVEKAATIAALPEETELPLLAPLGLVAAERAEADARPEIVDRILKRLLAKAAVGVQPEDLARLGAIQRRSSVAMAELVAARKAAATLKNASDDQGANHTMGVFLCLTRQDWANGIAHLAKGTDPKLVDAAKADLATPTDAKGQHRVGDLWYTLAIAAKDHRHKRAMLGRARIWFERVVNSKVEVADAIKAKARLDDIAKVDVPPKDAAALPLHSPVVVRRAYNTVGADVASAEWIFAGGAAARPDGIHLPAGNSALHSRFGIASGGRLTLAMRPDGREIRINYAGQEFAFTGGTGKGMRIAVERDDKSVTVTAQPDGGEPVSRSADLALLSRGPMPVTVRVTGTPSKPEGTMVTAAIARGPMSFSLPSAE